MEIGLRKLKFNTVITFKYIYRQIMQLLPSTFVRIPYFELIFFADKLRGCEKFDIEYNKPILVRCSAIICTCRYIDYAYNQSLFDMLFMYTT